MSEAPGCRHAAVDDVEHGANAPRESSGSSVATQSEPLPLRKGQGPTR
jgi:hypothetical protein